MGVSFLEGEGSGKDSEEDEEAVEELAILGEESSVRMVECAEDTGEGGGEDSGAVLR